MKSFKRYLKENHERKDRYYTTLNLYKEMSQEDITYYLEQLLPIIYKTLGNSDEVLVTVESVGN